MINDAATDVLEVLQSCRCCLLRPPDKGLKTPYTHLGKTEVYSDMIQECFDIHLSLENEECGICEACVGRLRDARDFKLQVRRSQAELQARRERVLRVKEKPLVKSEMDENDMSDGYDSTLNEEPPPNAEMSDDAMSDADPISLSCDGCALAPAEPARAAAARAWEQLAMACSVRLERLRDDKAPHASPTCRQTFRHEATLAAHARGHARHDAGPGEEARDTSAAHAGEDSYTCDYCGKQYARKISLIKHIQEHVTVTSYAGKICSKEISKKYVSTKERPVPTGDKLNNCLQNHITIHTGQKTYACNICSKKFKCRSYLTQHQRIHTGIKPYACDKCGKQFTFKFNLNRHISVHTGQRGPYSCEYCLKAFTSSTDLTRHQQIHMGIKPYTCDICKKQFTLKGNLTKHIILHTGQRPYSCEHCLKAFTTSSILTQHQLIHTGKKPYACDVCGMQFALKGSLKRHVSVHTKQRPYSCGHCSYAFKTKSGLIRHQLIHTGIRPYACDICKKQFTRKGHLQRHNRIHTRVRPATSVKKKLHEKGL